MQFYTASRGPSESKEEASGRRIFANEIANRANHGYHYQRSNTAKRKLVAAVGHVFQTEWYSNIVTNCHLETALTTQHTSLDMLRHQLQHLQSGLNGCTQDSSPYEMITHVHKAKLLIKALNQRDLVYEPKVPSRLELNMPSTQEVLSTISKMGHFLPIAQSLSAIRFDSYFCSSVGRILDHTCAMIKQPGNARHVAFRVLPAIAKSSSLRFRIDKDCKYVWFGIASADAEVSYNDWPGSNKQCWMFGSSSESNRVVVASNGQSQTLNVAGFGTSDIVRLDIDMQAHLLKLCVESKQNRNFSVSFTPTITNVVVLVSLCDFMSQVSIL